MAIRRMNRRPDWRSRFDRPYHEQRFAQPGDLPAHPMPTDRPPHYRHQRRYAWGRQGPFTGIGPHDYHPTDEQIYEKVCERLMRHGQVDARRIQVEVSDGQVRLRGAVSGPAERHMAADALWSIPGVQAVINLLRVTGARQTHTNPPLGWEYEAEASGGESRVSDPSEQSMLEAGLLPVTGAEPDLEDSPTWTIFTHEESDSALNEQEAGFEPSNDPTGSEATPAEKAISLAAGMEVVDRDGVVVGRVKEVRPDDFLLDRPLARDLYVPYSAVRSTGERAVLNLRSDEIGSQGWNRPNIL